MTYSYRIIATEASNDHVSRYTEGDTLYDGIGDRTSRFYAPNDDETYSTEREAYAAAERCHNGLDGSPAYNLVLETARIEVYKLEVQNDNAL